jgi:hypothetical protein
MNIHIIIMSTNYVTYSINDMSVTFISNMINQSISTHIVLIYSQNIHPSLPSSLSIYHLIPYATV